MVLLLLWRTLLWAQVNSCPENFKAYNSSGQEVNQFCVGQPIRFKSCLPNTQPDKEYYDFDKTNGVSFSTDTIKVTTYARPGTYTVTQLINTGQISQKERTFVVVDTPPPVFTAIACAQNQVRVTITDKIYDNFTVDFGDGTKQNLKKGASAYHQYTAGGALKVKVIASYSGATCTAQAEVNVTTLPAPIIPVLENLKISASGPSGTIALSIKNLQPEYIYVLERVAGSVVTPVDSLKNLANPVLSYTLNNINTSTSHCFRLRPTDKCGSNLNITSNTICSQPLTATAGNNQIVLTWPLYPEADNLENYGLYRNGILLQTLAANSASFTDNKVECGTKYCYQLRANLKNGYNAVSDDICVTAVTTHTPAPGQLSSTFSSNNQVILTFNTSGNTPAKNITYQKSTNNNPFVSLATTDKATFVDGASLPEAGKFCYQALYEDNCGKLSAASNSTCPILLKAGLSPDGTLNLTWTEYVGLGGSGYQYQIERVDASGTVLGSTPVPGTAFSEKINSPEQQQFYRIKASAPNQLEVTYSNTTLIRQESSYRIPTAFSPNGDNLNDRFEIKGKVFGSFRLQILDRWGQVIFVSTNPEFGWDGKIKGQDAPVGVYVYSLNGTDATGQQFTKTGSFTLVR